MVRQTVAMIESPHNPSFRKWARYAAGPEKRDCPWILVEGWKHCLDVARLRPVELFLFCTRQNSGFPTLLRRSRSAAELPERLLRRISQVETPQGALAFFAKPAWAWSDVSRYLLYLERVQDPGNLGTLIRTAASTGLFSIVTSRGTVSCFNSKVTRASAASSFSVPLIEGVELEEVLARGYRPILASPKEGESLFEVEFSPPLVICLGSEGAGTRMLETSPEFKQVRIPMRATQDSLNVGVAGSLMMYEVFRQNANDHQKLVS